jgi:hypothetical protein
VIGVITWRKRERFGVYVWDGQPSCGISNATFPSHRVFVHSISVSFQALLLLAGKLTQQIADDLCILVRLLLHLTLPDGVERAEQPHFLQVADKNLQVFGGFDLLRFSIQLDVLKRENKNDTRREMLKIPRSLFFLPGL